MIKKVAHVRNYLCRLDQNVITIGIVFHHSYNSPDLAFNTLQAIDQLFFLLF